MPGPRDLPTIGLERNPPDPHGTAGVFRRVGYSLEEALADLIDNSIDAQCANVLVRFVRANAGIRRVVVADDGHGMSETTLRKAMQYGVQTAHRSSDLGKYGIGLKAASFSQARSLSVVSVRNAHAVGRRWTLESIEKDWKQEIIDPHAARKLAADSWGHVDLSESGTLVVWDDLDALAQPTGDQVEAAISDVMNRVPMALGLTYHRLLQSGKLDITLDVINKERPHEPIPVTARPLDPFGYSSSGSDGFPVDFHVPLPPFPKLKLSAHIWPPKSNDPNYRLGGGKVAARQGFYFYRNDRLIQAGGWNGVMQSDVEPHYSLARVSIDLPAELDALFGLSLHKSKILPPPAFARSVLAAKAGTMDFREYLGRANEVYRDGKKHQVNGGRPRLIRGVPSGIAHKVNRSLGRDSDGDEFQFVWRSLRPGLLFEIDRASGSILLNQRYRAEILGGARASAADAPLFKTTLFLLLQNELGKQRLSKASQSWLAQCNSALLAALQVR